MYSFLNDYNEIAHPNILKAIEKNNLVQTDGYGDDPFCDNAKELIKKEFALKNSQIYFFIGGTAVNLTALSYTLRGYECIMATPQAHICRHEAGSVEATGHKILTVPSSDGKFDIKAAEKILEAHLEDEHMVLPRTVYISDSTETGTVYTKKELENISSFCKKNGLYLFLDGARLATGLTSKYSDVAREDLAKLTDMFYIGATKNGSPIGEALVINNPALQTGFVRHMKQKGSILAKGKILGICFEELFKDGLYWELGKHANDMAFKIIDALKDYNIDYTFAPESNQIFVNLNTVQKHKLAKIFAFSIDHKINDDLYAARFVTNWATDEKSANQLIDALKKEFEK